MKKVLISQPNFYNDHVWLPYVHATLKAYCNRNEQIHDNIEWLYPIFQNYSANVLLEPYDLSEIDVVGLSCYQWNIHTQMDIADEFHKANPECLIIVGGPEPDWNDAEFFEKYPAVDIVVRQDGEHVMESILLHVLDNNWDFSDISGIYLKQTGMHLTSAPILQREFDWEPYVDSKELFQDIIANNTSTFAMWETNRGCPYKCSFCDWGSAIMGKVRFFPMDRLEAEAEWFASSGVESIFITDANFGIHKRDVDITNMLCEHIVQNNNKLKTVLTLSAKNNPKNNLTIAIALFEANVLLNYVHSLQHTDQSVLDAIHRTNQKQKDEQYMVNELYRHGINSMPMFILGNPGDTVDKWFKCFTDVMEMGLHEEFRSNPFSLLPNAPAAQPNYMKTWDIQVVNRFVSYAMTRRPKNASKENLTKTAYVVGSSTYTPEDWAEFNVIDSFHKTFHSYALTRFLAMYLRWSIEISFNDSYRQIWDFCNSDRSQFVKPLLDTIRQHYLHYLEDECATEEIDIGEDWSDVLYLPDEWLFIKIMLGKKDFDADIDRMVSEMFEDIPLIQDVMHFQRDVVINMDYNSRQGRLFECEYNWPEYFDKITPSREGQIPVESIQKLTGQLKATDRFVGVMDRVPLRFHTVKGENKIRKYIDDVVGYSYTKSRRSYLKKFQTENDHE